ncbi:hypothetical protein [Anaerosolibacter sp.]|uniref:hypothetical protein n=1 Tax=Anaerosolibacter sp. TaxID=1872527 RepID=UPI0039EED7AC
MSGPSEEEIKRSLKTQEVFEDLLADIRQKNSRIKHLESELARIKGVLRELAKGDCK